jgi:simple sugar transport system permease protein
MFSLAGIMNILAPASQLGILAVAAALLMIGGEFDLSIGSMVAFTGLIFGALLTLSGLPLIVAIVLTLLIAALLGAINGQIVIRTRLPSFIVTLAFLFILRGLSLVGLKWATGGSTQLRGIGEQAGEGFVREIFSGVALEGVFSWLASAGITAKFPNGAPTVTGISRCSTPARPMPGGAFRKSSRRSSRP